MKKGLIFAAGGIVRKGNSIAVVHRPKYDDWSLPKGKLFSGETFFEAAVREVEEETQAIVRTDYFSGAIHYQLDTEYKFTLYWMMTALQVRPFIPNREIDQIKWIDTEQVMDVLNYPQEKVLLKCAFSSETKNYRSKRSSDRFQSRGMNHLEEAISILEQEIDLLKRSVISAKERHLLNQIDFLSAFK